MPPAYRPVSPASLCAADVSYYNSPLEIHPSARKHGVADEDIEHAATNAMTTRGTISTAAGYDSGELGPRITRIPVTTRAAAKLFHASGLSSPGSYTRTASSAHAWL